MKICGSFLLFHLPQRGIYLFLLLFFSSQVQAQEYKDIESNNIRIDPEWAVTHEAGEFAWASDIAIDKQGNIYATGFFQKSLKAGKDDFNPGTTCYTRCPDTYMLMKHDAKGNLAWVRYGIGSARPCKVMVDDKGFIYTVGNVYDKELYFTSSDTTKTKLKRPNDSSGIFICQYDADGKLIRTKFISESISETPNDFVIDSRDNVYIAGNYDFIDRVHRPQSRKGYLLLKLDANWDVLWKQMADTIGLSAITALCLDQSNNLYVTGNYNYSLDLGVLKLKRRNNPPFQNYPNTFVAKFNDTGQCAWVIDSLETSTLGMGKNMVCDKKGFLYIASNTGQSKVFFSKLDKDGKLLWHRTIQGNNAIDNMDMLIDGNHIYLCGEGYGAVFGSSGPQLFSFKSKGSRDFYLAKYNTKGECLWLKAGGGKGTDNCKSIALYKKALVAYGWFGQEMIFKDSIITSKSDYTFWLAKFGE